MQGESDVPADGRGRGEKKGTIESQLMEGKGYITKEGLATFYY